MHLIKIDIIGAEPTQTAFDCRLDMKPIDGSHSMSNRWHKPSRCRTSNLGRNNQRVARFSLDPLTKYLLGNTDGFRIRRHGVDLGGVEKIDSTIERRVENFK